MDIKEIVAFANFADSLDYQQAAADSEMTVAQLRDIIKHLEQELAVALVEKQDDEVQLSVTGQAIAAQARQITASWHQLQAIAAAKRREATQESVKLVVLPSFTDYAAAAAIGELINDKVDVSEETDPYQALCAGTGDIAFLREIDNVDSDKLDLILVDTDRLAAYIPTRNPLSQRKELKLTELQAERFLSLNHQTPLAEYIQRVCDDAGLYVYSVFEGGQAKTLINMVALGMGVALLMEKSIGNHFDHEKVTKVPLVPATTCQLAFARLKDASHTPVQEGFWQQLKNVFQKS